MTSTWLITGGAGYIGSHVVRDFNEAKISIVVLDNLSTGIRERVPPSIPFLRVDLKDINKLLSVFSTHRIEGVVHLAAKKSVIESSQVPFYYIEENVSSLWNLLTVMKKFEVKKIVYSSSSSVYGVQKNDLAKENDETNPISIYGKTKLVGEWMLQAACEWGLRSAALRYFNVAGSGSIKLQDYGVHNLIPMVFRALTNKESPMIFGDDYSTKDGTCVRDFIHVDDVSSAHLMFAQEFDLIQGSEIFNLGTGIGSSVAEVMQLIREITKKSFEIKIEPRREGDPPVTGADITKINTSTKWRAQKDLKEIIESSWLAWQNRN